MSELVSIQVQLERFDQISDLNNPNILDLCRAAQEASELAYAPYSNYKVGASVLLEDGSILKANNQENAVYPLGLCAERVAIYAASSQSLDIAIIALAVATHKPLQPGELPPFPCGSCRQVILEKENRYNRSIDLYIIGSDNSVCHVKGASYLLPFAFDASSL